EPVDAVRGGAAADRGGSDLPASRGAEAAHGRCRRRRILPQRGHSVRDDFRLHRDRAGDRRRRPPHPWGHSPHHRRRLRDRNAGRDLRRHSAEPPAAPGARSTALRGFAVPGRIRWRAALAAGADEEELNKKTSRDTVKEKRQGKTSVTPFLDVSSLTTLLDVFA